MADALNVHGWEAAGTAGYGAYAGTGHKLSCTRLDGASGSGCFRGTAGSIGSGGCVCGGTIIGAAVGASAFRGIASDGAAGALALLLDGHGLEYGLRLCGGRVDGEDHSLAAVARLCTVEPLIEILAMNAADSILPQFGQLTGGLVGHNLHCELGSGNDSIIRIGNKVRGYTTRQPVTGCIEAGLGDCVVLAHESEDNHIAYGGLDFRRRISEARRATDLNRVSCPRSRYSSCDTSRNGRGSHGRLCGTSCNCLCDGHGLVDCCCLGTGAGVYPNDDNLGVTGLEGYGVAAIQNLRTLLHVTISCLHGIDISDHLSHG